MEKKILASFDIEGIDDLIKDTGELVRRQTELRESSKKLDKTTEEGSQQFVKQSNEMKSLGKQISSNNKLIQATTGVTSGLNAELNKEIFTINQARASNTKLLELRNSLNLSTKEGQRANQDINKQLDSNNAFIKENVSQYEKQKIGIGDYTTAIKGAFAETGGFNQQLGVLTQAMSSLSPLTDVIKNGFSDIKDQFNQASGEANALSGSQRLLTKANAASSASFKVLKLAIASTGIGLLLIALGSLVAFLSKSQKGIDLMGQAFAGITAFVDVFVDRLIKVGEILTNVFSQSFLKTIGDTKDAFKGIGDEISREIDLAVKLKKSLQEVEKEEVTLSIRRKATDAQLKELNKTIEDTSKTEEERLKAARLFSEIDAELTEEQVLNQERKVAALLGFSEVTEDVTAQIEKIKKEGVSLDSLGLSESTLDDAKEFRDEINKLSDLQSASSEKQTTNQNKLNTLDKQIKSDQLKRAKDALDREIKDNETRLNLFIKENEVRNGTLKESLDFEKQVFEQSSKNLEIQLKAQGASQEESELARLELKQDYLDRQTALTIENADKEFALLLQENKTRIESGDILTDELLKQELDRIDLISNARKEKLNLQRENDLISELEFLQKKGEQEDEFNTQRQAVIQEKESQDKALQAEADAIDLENKRALSEENELLFLEQKRIDLEARRSVEIEEAEKTGANIDSINAKFDAEEIKRKGDVRDAKIKIGTSFLSAISSILGSESSLGKAVAVGAVLADKSASISRIISNTGVANAKAVAASPLTGGQPFVTINSISAGASIAATGASAAKAIGEINKGGKKAAKGITLKGNSHSQGGIDLYDAKGNHIVEAQGDENVYVLNKNASEKINALSNLNVATGGIPLSNSVNFARDGGLVSRSISSSSNISEIAELIDGKISRIMVQNVASDTLGVATEESIIVQNANL